MENPEVPLNPSEFYTFTPLFLLRGTDFQPLRAESNNFYRLDNLQDG